MVVVVLIGFVVVDVTGLGPSLMVAVVMVCLVVPNMIRLWRRLGLFGSAGAGWSSGHDLVV